MVRSIQPEWVCGPRPPGDGRHGQAIGMIAGIYAVHVLDQERCPRKWYENFQKIWHRGGHKRDFNKACRGSRPDDHDYYKSHYEPGRRAKAHHVKALADTDAWRRRVLQCDDAEKIVKKSSEIDKRRQAFQDLVRHQQEQKDLWSKAEGFRVDLTGMAAVAADPPRARDLPLFNPQQIGTRGDLIPVGLHKDPNVFHPEYTNLHELDRYLKNLDSKKRELLQSLRARPGRVPHEELWNITVPHGNQENATAVLEVSQIKEFEKTLDHLIDQWRAKESLKPPTRRVEGVLLDQIEESGSEEDHQHYGL